MWKTICARNIKNSSALAHLPKPSFGCQGAPSFELKKADNLQLATIGCFFVPRPTSHVPRKGIILLLIALTFLCSACSTPYHAYSQGIFQGKEALKKGDYAGAKRDFEEAYQNDKSPEALMYLAIIDYKTNNLDSAEKLIREAEMMGSGNYHYLRVLGYKALILLKKDRDQGLEALDRYVSFYALRDPLMSINDVQEMVRSGNIDMQHLEGLIEEQVSWFENDVELYWSSGVGYYDGRDVYGGPFRFRGGGIYR
jgi:tetratricopeptide (TPR) repeat protein